jgi:hypothetical protein
MSVDEARIAKGLKLGGSLSKNGGRDFKQTDKVHKEMDSAYKTSDYYSLELQWIQHIPWAHAIYKGDTICYIVKFCHH